MGGLDRVVGVGNSVGSAPQYRGVNHVGPSNENRELDISFLTNSPIVSSVLGAIQQQLFGGSPTVATQAQQSLRPQVVARGIEREVDLRSPSERIQRRDADSQCDVIGPIGGYTFTDFNSIIATIVQAPEGLQFLTQWKNICLGQLGDITPQDISALNPTQQRLIVDFVFRNDTNIFSQVLAQGLLDSPYPTFLASSSCTELAGLRLSDQDVRLMLNNATWIDEFPALPGVTDPGVVLLMSRFRESLPTEVLSSTAFRDLVGYLSAPQSREVVNFLLKQPQECLVDQQSEAARAAATPVVVDPLCSATPVNGIAVVLPDRFASARLDVRIANLAKSINATALLITSTQEVDAIDLSQLFKDINENAIDTASQNFALKYAKEKLGACLGEPYFNFDAVTLPAPVTWTTVSTFFNANKQQLFPVFATLAGSPGLDSRFARFQNLTATSPNITDAEAETLVNMLEIMGYTVPNIQPPPTTTVDPNATTPASSPAPSRNATSSLLPGVLGGVAGALLLTLLAVILVMRARRPKPLPFLEGATRFTLSPYIYSVRNPVLLTLLQAPKIVVVTVHDKNLLSIQEATNGTRNPSAHANLSVSTESSTRALMLNPHEQSIEHLAPESTLTFEGHPISHQIKIDGVKVLDDVPLLSLLVLSSLFPKLFLPDSTSPTASASSVPQPTQASFSIRVEVPTRKDLHVLLNLVSTLASVDTMDQKRIYDLSVTQAGLDRVKLYCQYDEALQKVSLDTQSILNCLDPNSDIVIQKPELSFLILARVLQIYSGKALDSIEPLAKQDLADALYSFATKASEAWSTHWPSSAGVKSKHFPLTKDEYLILKKLLSGFQYDFGFLGLCEESITEIINHYSHYPLVDPQVFFEKQGDPGYLVYNDRELSVDQLLAYAQSTEGFKDLSVSVEGAFKPDGYSQSEDSQHAVVISADSKNTALFVTEALFKSALAAVNPPTHLVLHRNPIGGFQYSPGESSTSPGARHFGSNVVFPTLHGALNPYDLIPGSPLPESQLPEPFSELPVLEEVVGGFLSLRASSPSKEEGSFGFDESSQSSSPPSQRHSISEHPSKKAEPPASQLSSLSPSSDHSAIKNQVKSQTVTVFLASSTLPVASPQFEKKTYLTQGSLELLVKLKVNINRGESNQSTTQHLQEFLNIFFQGVDRHANLTLRELFHQLVKNERLETYPEDSDAKKDALKIYARERGFITAEELIQNREYGFQRPVAGYDLDGSGSISAVESTSIPQGYVAKTNAMLQEIKFGRQQGSKLTPVTNMEDLTVAEFFSLQFMFRQIQYFSADTIEETRF